MKVRLCLALFLLVLTFTSCNDPVSDITPKGQDKQEQQTDNKGDSANDNQNGNTLQEAGAERLEMPHIDASLFYAPHYVTYQGRTIMNLAIEWNGSMRHAPWVAYSFDAVTSQTSQQDKHFCKYIW